MNRIKQLPTHEIQKIAAGEVVERPTNAVKELLENALDAGATVISIYIEDAGKKLIRVIDNGCGMNDADARFCFVHHATSKISSVHDLTTISSFGFRGEALSSIASVSKITLVTREADATQGTKVVLHAGDIICQDPIACAPGTDIAVTELFYNVPARKKFLKTKETEWRQITLLFQAFCLDYTAVHFRLFSDGNQIFNCPAVSSLSDRVIQLWDQRMAQHMIPFSAQDSEKTISITGLMSTHHYYRYDRSCFFFFVNGRWIKSLALSKAVLKGYMNVLPPDRLPAVFLFITIDPEQVDINIHPRKEEVHFLHSRFIEILVQDTIKKNLEGNLSQQLGRPVTLKSEERSFYQPASRSIDTPYLIQEAPPPVVSSLVAASSFSSSLELGREERQENIMPASAPLSYEDGAYDWTTQYTIIGQLRKTYVLLEHPDGLFLVDQHAAHERILYERFSTRFEEISCVALIFPQIVTITTAEHALIMTHTTLFKELGIELESFGQSQCIITATPVHVKDISFDDIVRQAAALIAEHSTLPAEEMKGLVHHDLRAQMACKAAVKAGDELTTIQMTQLLDDLAQIPNRFTCPHGRPTGWLLRADDIEKKFKRRL